MSLVEPVSRRSEHLERGRALQSQAYTALRPFNDDLSGFSSHEAVVLFGINKPSRTAASLVAVESSAPIDTRRHQFRRQNIDSHIMDLAATAFGASLRELAANPSYDSWFEESRLNPGVHMTWTPSPITDNEEPIAAPELAFSVAHGDVPKGTKLERIYDTHKSTIEEIAHAFRAFEKEVGPLQDTLELKRPITPNSVIIRWDLEGSTELMTDEELEPIAANYLRDLKRAIAQILNGKVHATIDGGDGQNIIIDIPTATNLADPVAIKKFERQTIQPIVTSLIQKQDELSHSYTELGSPRMTLSTEAGYVNRGQDDYIDNAVLWRVARSLKQK